MSSSEERRTSVVTGIAGGIGSALGRVLRENGYSVIGVDCREPLTADVCDHFLLADLVQVGSSQEAAASLARKISDTCGAKALDLLVNNAAVQHIASTADMRWDAWQETLAVNLSAPFALSRLLLPKLQTARGAIVNIGSVHAVATKPGFAAYATSKAALHGLTRALAVDLGPLVRVVAVAPAAVETPMLEAGFANEPSRRAELESVHPLGRIAKPDEVANAVLFLASRAAAFATGSVFWLDGGVLSRLHDPA